MLSPQESRAAQWVRNNRGVLTKIAKAVRPPVSPQYVQMVLNGKRKSTNGRIEAMLKKHGWSGAPQATTATK